MSLGAGAPGPRPARGGKRHARLGRADPRDRRDLLLAATPRLARHTVVTGLLGLIVVMLAAQRPDLSLLGLIVLLPFQGLLLAKLCSWGLPASVVSHLGAWKEALALGRDRRRGQERDRHRAAPRHARPAGAGVRRADACLYAALQPAIVPGAPSASNIRLLGFRETGGFVAAAVRRSPRAVWSGFARRATRARARRRRDRRRGRDLRGDRLLDLEPLRRPHDQVSPVPAGGPAHGRRQPQPTSAFTGSSAARESCGSARCSSTS